MYNIGYACKYLGEAGTHQLSHPPTEETSTRLAAGMRLVAATASLNVSSF